MGPQVIILACITLAGCQSPVGLTSSFCDPRSGIEPIRLNSVERQALAALPKRIILSVNNYGARNCGWKP